MLLKYIAQVEKYRLMPDIFATTYFSARKNLQHLLQRLRLELIKAVFCFDSLVNERSIKDTSPRPTIRLYTSDRPYHVIPRGSPRGRMQIFLIRE